MGIGSKSGTEVIPHDDASSVIGNCMAFSD
jgi:hypothetical protein